MKHRKPLNYYSVTIPMVPWFKRSPESDPWKFGETAHAWACYDLIEEANEAGKPVRSEWIKGVAKDPHFAYLYALKVLKGRFEAGEKTVAKRKEYAFAYAFRILKRRPFKLAEAEFKTHPDYILNYAFYILKDRFLDAELNLIGMVVTGQWFACDGWSEYRKMYLAHFPEARSDWINNGWISWFD